MELEREREREGGAGRGTESNGKSELSRKMQSVFEEKQWREAEQLEEWRRWEEERQVREELYAERGSVWKNRPGKKWSCCRLSWKGLTYRVRWQLDRPRITRAVRVPSKQRKTTLCLISLCCKGLWWPMKRSRRSGFSSRQLIWLAKLRRYMQHSMGDSRGCEKVKDLILQSKAIGSVSGLQRAKDRNLTKC